MKNLIFIFLLCFIVFSCSKDQLKYSCDPEIDAIVKSGEVEFSQLGLSEFLEYDIVLQKAIFRSFSPEKKRDYWIEKLDSLVQSQKYNGDEKLHIEALKEHLTPDYFAFERLDSLMFTERKEFEHKWTYYAKDVLSWSEFEIHFILNSLCIYEDQYSQIIEGLNQITLSALGGNCGCSTESDYCSDQGARCSEYSCNQTSGCGTFWQYICNGECT